MKMAREGRLRKPHRRDWPAFLNRVIPARVWQDFWAGMGRPEDNGKRWTAKYVVLCWVMMGWSLQTQLAERFREATELLIGLFPHRRRPGRSYPGLVRATPRVGQRVFGVLWDCLRQTIPRLLGKSWRWYGWVVMSVDGSRIDTARTRRNERRLRIAGRAKTHPQWWVTWVTHLPSNLLWDWRQGPGTSSERAHLREMLPTLPASTLLVADVGFCGFDLLWTLWCSGVHFLVRCASNTTLLTDRSRSQIERKGQHCYLYLWPQQNAGLPPLRLRVIVLKSRGRRVYLLTNVVDSTRLSRPMAGELYRARWGIEVGYRSLKQTMGRCKVLARTPEAGASELSGSILALGLLMLQAALRQGRQVVRLSIARALGLVRRAIEAVRCGLPSTKFVERLAQALGDTYPRRKSKRARDWPHKKREPPPSPPKLRRPNPKEKAAINLFWTQIWLYPS
jgi:hypothetical protein